MRNLQARVKIEKRLRIVKLGNLGNYRSVGEGVCELKITYGPGYRVYFGFRESTLIIILCGGDKSTQSEDIVNAIKYWKDYEKRESTDQ